MGQVKKKKRLLKKLKNKYRLAIFNEQSYEEVFHIRLSRLNVFTITVSSGILLIILVIFLIAFTSLREYIPGYPDSNQRLLIVRNALQVDSLALEIERRDQFINNILVILRGDSHDDDEPADDRSLSNTNNNDYREVSFTRSEADSLFRHQIEREERFNLSVQTTQSRPITLENTFFVSPIRGMVINSFMETQGHYGVDIVAAQGSHVSAIMDGIVIFSGWTVETGYVIQIQHPNNILSLYKHNEVLLKDVGQMVKAGEVIARIGNTGELTTGPHLHFELWYDGTPLNPVDYIAF